MFFNFRRLKTGAVVVLAMLSMPVAGQDLLARQAPIDKKMSCGFGCLATFDW